MSILLYTTATCPKCNVAKQKLDGKGIRYNVCDDMNEMSSLGLMSVPALSIDGVLYRDFASISKVINTL